LWLVGYNQCTWTTNGYLNRNISLSKLFRLIFTIFANLHVTDVIFISKFVCTSDAMLEYLIKALLPDDNSGA